MSQEQIDKLRNKVFGKEKKTSLSETLVSLARETSGLGDLLGKEYEVYDPNGKLVFRIKQKPLKTVQLNIVLGALNKLQEKEKQELDKSTRKGRR